MSYFANGDGKIIPKEEIPDEILMRLSNAEFLVDDAPDGGIWLTFDNMNYNDQVEESMKAVAPYVGNGNVEFTGEDGEHWRYEFENGKVFCADGKIVYERRLEL